MLKNIFSKIICIRIRLKILVTGGAGFIASQIADKYIDVGHDVFIVDDLSTGFKRNINPKAVFIEKDIKDKELWEVFSEEKFDVVNHHAAQMDVRRSVLDPKFDAETNVLGTLNLLQNCVKYNVSKFIFASTGGAVYGDQDEFPATEDHPTNPLSPYGITKLSVEKYLYFYFKEYGLKYTILRYANVYGPRQNPFGEAGVVAIFTSKLLKDEQPVINGTGAQTRDYVFVDDVVQANLIALNLNEPDIFNIGTGIETDVNYLFNSLNSITGKNKEEKHGPPAAGEQLRSVISSKKIFNKSGWKPSVKVDDGLHKTVEYFKEANNEKHQGK